MSSKQYQSKVNVIRKRVNQLSESSQYFPVVVVNLFSMDSQMLKIQA